MNSLILKSVFYSILISLTSFLNLQKISAQIIPDSTLGKENSVVNQLNQDKSLIEGGAIRGENLFHSFGEFNIESNQSVYFFNPDGVNNILTRVTGKNISQIFGTLGVEGNANLFLVNPNGIIFGENAQLDINGSFTATTGDIQLGADAVFSATNISGSSLLTAQPQALFSNRQNQIDNQATLVVRDGQNIVLIADKVINTGDLLAPKGTIHLEGNEVDFSGKAIASSGIIEILGKETVALLDNATINVSSVTDAGTILIGGDWQGKGEINSLRTYVGDQVTIKADALINGNGGKVVIWAEEVTGFYGNITAKGGIESGNGGLVEVSGKEHLIFRGKVDTTAVNGLSGNLLLDPTNIIIANDSGDEAGDGNDTFAGNNSGIVGSILSTPLSEIEDTAPTTIYESELESLSGDTNIVLQATNDIRLEDLSDDRLDFSTGKGLIVFSADADRDGTGDFVMEDNLEDTIFTNGRDIVISGANLTIGSLNTSLLNVPDAGNLIDTALLVSDSSGQNLTSIKGNISRGGDIDLFKIYLTGGGTFSASTVNSETSIDTQLFLFDINGLGVYSNDDQAGCFCFQSTLPNGDALTPTESGVYYLGISTFLVNPFSSSGEIFPDSFTAGFEAIKAPIGDGGSFPLSEWVGFFFQQGSYTINLTGVEALESTFRESFPRDSGSINLNASNNVSINGLIETSLSSDNGGNVDIKANNVFLTNSAQILSIARGEGDGGDINIQTGSLFLLDGSFIETRTLGRGKGGLISITAQDAIEISGENKLGFNNGIRSIVSAGATGDSGGITINTNSLLVKDGGAIDATTFGGGNAGDIIITAIDTIEISGEDSDGNPSFIETLNLFATGNSGDITINTGTLLLQGGSFLETSVIFGQGNSGTITINAQDKIEISGKSSQGEVSLIRSLVDPDPNAQGNSGKIIINTNSLSLTDGALLDTRAFGEGKAGEININSSELTIEKGASISAFSGDRGDAGDINLTLTESLFISGNGSGLFADTGKNSTGKGGNITVNAPLINLEKKAAIAVSSLGEGIGGDIEIMGKTLNLNNSDITAQTLSSDGGNLNFNLQNLLSLSQSSNITATAGTAQAGGDGGNITINSPFIISTSSNPLNAITANAFQGQGGNIEINTNFIFGGEFLLIDASSQLGIDGEVSINDPNVDPTSGFITVKAKFIDAEGLIARSPCAIEEEQIAGGSSFVVKGRGGLPTTPEETTSNSDWLLEWVSPELTAKTPINETKVNQWLVKSESQILFNNQILSKVNSCSVLSP